MQLQDKSHYSRLDTANIAGVCSITDWPMNDLTHKMAIHTLVDLLIA